MVLVVGEERQTLRADVADVPIADVPIELAVGRPDLVDERLSGIRRENTPEQHNEHNCPQRPHLTLLMVAGGE